MLQGDISGQQPTIGPGGASFATRLRRYRRRARLSQEALAERAGVSVRAISGLERGEGHVPYAETVRLLATALDLSPAEHAQFVAAARPATARRGPAHPHETPVSLVGGASPLGAASHPPTRPPAPLAPLIGRAAELAAASELLRQPTTRLLTVTGAPGVGKTRFALQLAADVGPGTFPDGVVFLDLAPLRDPAQVIPTLAAMVGVAGAPHWATTERLLATLSGRRLLLICDTFEHVLAAGAALGGVLQGCVGLTALVTSRVPLRLPGEHELRLSPLALPAPARADQPLDAVALAALAATPAVTLFAERARSAQPSFALTSANAIAVATLCRRLDGLPLALELAAARVALLPAQVALARLSDQLDALATGEHALPGYPDRQRTLRAALTWSYDLLTPTEQWVFRQMGVFAGGASIEAVEAICTTPPPIGPTDDPSAATSTKVVDALIALAQHNLLIVEADDADAHAAGRLRMLDTIYAFAGEQLGAEGETAAAQRAHAQYFVANAERAVWRYRQNRADAWDNLTAELANLRAALHWATTSADPGAWALGLRLATALGPFWYLNGLPHEGSRWLDEYLQLSPRRSQPLRAGPAPTDLDARRQRAKALYMAGWLALDQGFRQRAVLTLTASVAAFREVVALTAAAGDAGDAGDAGASEQADSSTLAEPGVSDGGRRRDDLSVDDEDSADDAGYASDDDLTWLSDALNRLGDVSWRQGKYAEAVALFTESLGLRRQVGDELAVANSLNNLAAVAVAQAQWGAAITLLDDSQARYRRLACDWGEIDVLIQLADIARRQQAFPRATELLDEALVVARLRGAAYAEAYLLGEQGELARAQGDLVLAETRWQASLAERRVRGGLSRYGVAQALCALGDVARDGQRAELAMSRYLESLAVFQAVAVVDGVVICLERIATLATTLGRYAEATRLFALAEATRERLGFPLSSAERVAQIAAVSQAYTALGEERAALAWATGQATPWDHAAALAHAAADAPDAMPTP